jgi:DNA recombination protein RmuC
MTVWLWLAIGVAFGAGVAELAGRRARAAAESRARDAEARAAAAQATAESWREQQRKSEEERQALRAKLDAEQTARAAAEAALEAERRHLDEQRRLLDEAGVRLSETFKALSSDVLGSQSESFLKLAREALTGFMARAEGDLAQRQQAIDALVRPLKESLERYDLQLREMEKARQAAYGTLSEQLRSLAATNEQLQRQAGSLENALKGGPQVRGRWGEMTLRRVAELAGMSEHCDFAEQETLTGNSGRVRPDMIVDLPGGRRIAVDAKAPLQAFLDATGATTEEQRRACLERHAQFVRAHLNQLAARAYWDQLNPAPELVVLFLPGESFFSAALEQDRTLIEDGIQKRVILATPTTLIALLHAVAYGWRQEQMAQNAQKVSELGKQLYDRLRIFIRHFAGVGEALKGAVSDYNSAVGSLESRVLIPARKLKDLGAASGDDLTEVPTVDEIPRALSAPEAAASIGPIPDEARGGGDPGDNDV